jgi:hypothetical protein
VMLMSSCRPDLVAMPSSIIWQWAPAMSVCDVGTAFLPASSQCNGAPPEFERTVHIAYSRNHNTCDELSAGAFVSLFAYR